MTFVLSSWTYTKNLAPASLYPTSGRERCPSFLRQPRATSMALVCSSSLNVRWPLLPWLGSGSLALCGCSKPGVAIPEPEEPHVCHERGAVISLELLLCVLVQLSFAPVQGLPAASSSTGTQNCSAELLLSHSVPSLSLSCSCRSKIPSQSLPSTPASR